MRPQGGVVPIIPIRSGEDISTMPIEFLFLPGVLPYTPVILPRRRALDAHTPLNAAFAMIFFVTGVRNVYGINLIAAIPWFVGRGKTGMVQ